MPNGPRKSLFEFRNFLFLQLRWSHIPVAHATAAVAHATGKAAGCHHLPGPTLDEQQGNVFWGVEPPKPQFHLDRLITPYKRNWEFVTIGGDLLFEEPDSSPPTEAKLDESQDTIRGSPSDAPVIEVDQC